MVSTTNVTLFNDPSIVIRNNRLIGDLYSKSTNASFKVIFWALDERYKNNRPMGRPIDPGFDITSLLIDPVTKQLQDNPMNILVNALRSYMNKAKYKDVNNFVLSCISK